MAEERDQNQGSRRRRILSINSQIDKIQDASLRDYTQNLDRRISSLADRQARLLNQLYDDIEKEEKARLKKSFNDRQDAMRQSLEDWRSYNKQIRSDLGLADRFATDVLYWNRRRNLRDLEREARYRFDDIADEAEEAAKSIEDSFSGLSESLRDWATALNVNNLVSGLEDSQKSMRDLRVEMQKYVTLSEGDWESIRTISNQLSKEADYTIARTEFIEKMNEVLQQYNDLDFAKGILNYSTKLGYLGVNPDQLTGVYDLSNYNTELVNSIMSQMARIQTTNGSGTSASDIASAIEDVKLAIKAAADGDQDKLTDMMQQVMLLQTAAGATDVNSITEKLFEFMNTAPQDWTKEQFLLLGEEGRNLINAGKLDEAAKLLASNFTDKFGGMSREQALAYASVLDMDISSYADLLEPGAIDEYLSALTQFDQIIAEEANATVKYLESWTNEGATALDKASNWKDTTIVGDVLDDLSNELDITLAEGMLITSGLIDIGKLVGGLFKGKGAAGAAAKTGLLAKVFGSASAGTGLSGAFANTAINLGAGNLAGGASMSAGGLAATGAASVAGGVIGGASIISGIFDIANASSQETWQEEADEVTQGALKIGGTAAAAGVGAAIGSIVPGIGTAVGALVGAGVGGLATLIWGDDWAQQLTDSLDGTKEIKEAIQIIETNATGLSQALAKDQELDNLITTYEDLRSKMETAQEGTSEYKSYQDQLNTVVSQINDIYPGYIDLNNDDYELMDKQIAVTQKLADAELALYKARVLTSGDEVLEGVTNAYSQYTKSKEEGASANREAEILGAWSEFWTKFQTGMDEGKWSYNEATNSVVRGSATDEEWNYLMDNASRARDTMTTYSSAWDGISAVWGTNEVKLGTAWKTWQNGVSGEDGEKIFSDAYAAQADILEKEATLANILTSQMATYESMLSASSWEEVARNWNTADASDKSMLLQIGKMYGEVGPEFYGYLPDMYTLEDLANTDLTADGQIGIPHGGSGGHFAIGLSRVPYDNFAAYLHKDEAILTAEEADIWRQATAGWTPNDKSQALHSTGNVVINQIDAGSDEPDDASNEEIIDTLKWLAKEIKESIEDLKDSDDSKMNSNQLLQLLLKSRLNSSISNSVFSFVR